ncbi:hypothetical protein B2G88_11055 [Natronolimnobius baerhuensis]|uniref:Uncharacterized protein n=2 Tax=Natronolimnobius baerhuensis TaxID=253108 RepID=A0A202E9Q1_9EURY|nr:hypothetical protein B2G88_11055 [Natronolimnobius baerhuensis]
MILAAVCTVGLGGCLGGSEHGATVAVANDASNLEVRQSTAELVGPPCATAESLVVPTEAGLARLELITRSDDCHDTHE